MVKAIVNIDEASNRIINIGKAKENLKDKSEAINLITEQYVKDILEPEILPEFINELLEAQKEKIIKIWNFSLYYN